MSQLGTVLVADALAQRLREDVLDGVIPPGAMVAETDIAARFGVSRPTAKGAITTLVHSGLMRRDSHRPAYVPRLTPDDVRDIFWVRISLEREAIRAVAERGVVPVDAEDAIREMRALPDDPSASQFLAADLRFHRALVSEVRSPRFNRVYDVILGELHLAMRQANSVYGKQRALTEHSAVLDRVRARDVAGAETALVRHLTTSGDALAAATAASAVGESLAR